MANPFMAQARKESIRQRPPPNAAPAAAGEAQRWRVPGLCVGLAAITLAVFGQTLHHEFINFDDGDVNDNPVVARGLTVKGVVWAFAQIHSDNWFPLNWLSHMLDSQLYGLNPGGHHLTNVLLHTATVILLFLVLRRMTGALWRSAFVAAVFAIHPLRVESVAWVAERKDVLSGLFFMLTLGAYARYAEIQSLKSEARNPATRNTRHASRITHHASRYYLLCVFFFALGLMCKPMLVTLPVVLLLLDYWPLRRLFVPPLHHSTTPPLRLLLEKLPLLALSAASCVITLLAQHEAIQSTGVFSPSCRLANALAACLVYLGQMVWPAGLAAFYPYPLSGLPAGEVMLAGMLLAGLSAFAWGRRRQQPWILIGWLWYLVMLLPVLGIIQVGGQSHADRYTYLPQIGIYLAVTWLVAGWGAKRGVGRAFFAGLMSVVLAALMVCAWRQTAYWKDSETLWTHALACTTDNDVANNSLGLALSKKGRVDEAIACFQRALQINPGYGPAHASLGNMLLPRGRVDEAITHYQSALQIESSDAAVLGNLGIALFQKGRVDEAIRCFQQALQIKPDYAAHNNLGIALARKGRVDEAIAEYQKALAINSDFAEAHNNLGNALLQQGKVDEAIARFQQALQINPAFAKAHNNLGKALLQKGSADQAIVHCQDALQISPDYADARVNLGNAFMQKGSVGEAITQFRKALQLEPGEPNVQYSLAWLLATAPQAALRNGEEAVQLARQANERTGGKDPIFLHTLAAAFAEAGRFGDAVQSAQKALDLARAAGRPDLAARLNGELKRYEAGLPLHQ
jgi:tetratricopeptide (TPR) repeat protein